MPTTAHGLRYPSTLDGRGVPADLMKLAEDVDPRLVWSAADTADRDARYVDLPAGALVTTSKAPWFVWLKTGAGNSWLAILFDTGWVTTGFLMGGDWSEGNFLKARQQGQIVEIRASVVYSSTTDLVANAAGNAADSQVVTVPPQFTPTDSVPMVGVASTTSGGMMLYPSGRVTVTDLHPTSKITNGDQLRFHATFLKD